MRLRRLKIGIIEEEKKKRGKPSKSQSAPNVAASPKPSALSARTSAQKASS
jgi:hypothetical protein